jgi:hypothetical protein
MRVAILSDILSTIIICRYQEIYHELHEQTRTEQRESAKCKQSCSRRLSVLHYFYTIIIFSVPIPFQNAFYHLHMGSIVYPE